jgi:hypothetical protein
MVHIVNTNEFPTRHRIASAVSSCSTCTFLDSHLQNQDSYGVAQIEVAATHRNCRTDHQLLQAVMMGAFLFMEAAFPRPADCMCGGTAQPVIRV